MRHLILVTGLPGRAAASHPAALLSTHKDLQFEHINWEMLSHDSSELSAARLLLVYAGEAMRVFSWLRDHRIRPRVLAILPAEPERELWNAASETADDFLLAPVRMEEFEMRVLRLLPGISVHQLAIKMREWFDQNTLPPKPFDVRVQRIAGDTSVRSDLHEEQMGAGFCQLIKRIHRHEIC